LILKNLWGITKRLLKINFHAIHYRPVANPINRFLTKAGFQELMAKRPLKKLNLKTFCLLTISINKSLKFKKKIRGELESLKKLYECTFAIIFFYIYHYISMLYFIILLTMLYSICNKSNINNKQITHLQLSNLNIAVFLNKVLMIWSALLNFFLIGSSSSLNPISSFNLILSNLVCFLITQ
jgi:hypothetical protein